jgi:hypothetical protein
MPLKRRIREISLITRLEEGRGRRARRRYGTKSRDDIFKGAVDMGINIITISAKAAGMMAARKTIMAEMRGTRRAPQGGLASRACGMRQEARTRKTRMQAGETRQ